MFHLEDRELAQKIVSKLKQRNLNLQFMHVCGTHQDTLVRHGLDVLFKECGMEIRQGPGCPVCVTTPKEIEEILLLARRDKLITTFGDMLNVPGEKYALQDLRAEGCGIYPVYGIEDAIRIANKNSNKEVVFMAIGFETTAPTTASILLKDPPSNFSVLSCHRLIPPVLKAILEMGELRIDGLIEPGHVSVIIGLNPYRFISKDYKIPQVVAGFEPMDLLIGVWMLAEQIEKGEAKVENEYTRAVKEEGNLKAREAIQKVFELKDTEWRGFPVIPKSGLKLKQKFEKYDAEKKFEEELIELKSKEFSEPRGCRCGELLRGLITPAKCPLFGRKCTPSHPVGPCMVSREGSCSIEFKYSKSK